MWSDGKRMTLTRACSYRVMRMLVYTTCRASAGVSPWYRPCTPSLCNIEKAVLNAPIGRELGTDSPLCEEVKRVNRGGSFVEGRECNELRWSCRRVFNVSRGKVEASAAMAAKAVRARRVGRLWSGWGDGVETCGVDMMTMGHKVWFQSMWSMWSWSGVSLSDQSLTSSIRWLPSMYYSTPPEPLRIAGTAHRTKIGRVEHPIIRSCDRLPQPTFIH